VDEQVRQVGQAGWVDYPSFLNRLALGRAEGIFRRGRALKENLRQSFHHTLDTPLPAGQHQAGREKLDDIPGIKVTPPRNGLAP